MQTEQNRKISLLCSEVSFQWQVSKMHKNNQIIHYGLALLFHIGGNNTTYDTPTYI